MKIIIIKINYIQDTYAKLALEMDEIDKAQAQYTKATTEKVIYLNNSDKTIKGKLETIFLSLAKVINGEDRGSVYPSIVRDINNSIMLYQQGYIDDESLIPQENIVVTMTQSGYIKRIPVYLWPREVPQLSYAYNDQ